MMFWNKKNNPDPHGIRLEDLASLLAPTSIKTRIANGMLFARSDGYETVVKVVAPVRHGPEDASIKAVILLTTDLPKELCEFFEPPEMISMANAFAGLGALCRDGERVFVGSRLTVYESPDVWRQLHLPLVFYTTLSATETLVGAVRRSLGQESSRKTPPSIWVEADFAQVEDYLSPHCVCTSGGLGFTAEFGLSNGSLCAAAGDLNTALFQLQAEESHPELGSGMMALLQMPHEIDDRDRLLEVCERLNLMEMSPFGLPPHFGAWCPGRRGNNPAYVSYYLNALHAAADLAGNVAFWAKTRAHWANARLAELGILC